MNIIFQSLHGCESSEKMHLGMHFHGMDCKSSTLMDTAKGVVPVNIPVGNIMAISISLLLYSYFCHIARWEVVSYCSYLHFPDHYYV